MIALILVAGNSRRMGDITAQQHKTLLDTGGKPILQRMLEALIRESIHSVCFVCGYRKDELKSFVAERFPELETTWVENPVYDRTNTGFSVWLTRDTLEKKGEDILLINGDVVLDHRAVAATIQGREGTVLAVRLDRVAEEEVKVRLDEKRIISEIGKHIPPAEADGESVGINRLSAGLLTGLYDVLEERITTGHGEKEFYEASFDELIRHGRVFAIADITELPVMEVDTPEDYREVLETIVPHLEG